MNLFFWPGMALFPGGQDVREGINGFMFVSIEESTQERRLYRMYGQEFAPAIPALPPSLAVVCRERRGRNLLLQFHMGHAQERRLYRAENCSSATAPAFLYLLHPCSRVFSAFTTSLWLMCENGVAQICLCPGAQGSTGAAFVQDVREGINEWIPRSIEESIRARPLRRSASGCPALSPDFVPANYSSPGCH